MTVWICYRWLVLIDLDQPPRKNQVIIANLARIFPFDHLRKDCIFADQIQLHQHFMNRRHEMQEKSIGRFASCRGNCTYCSKFLSCCKFSSSFVWPFLIDSLLLSFRQLCSLFATKRCSIMGFVPKSRNTKAT